MLQDYKFLTFARIPPPAPPPWVETHALLQAAINAFVKQQAAQLSDLQHCSLASAAAELHLEWYCSMLARLHINSFRFVPPVCPALSLLVRVEFRFETSWLLALRLLAFMLSDMYMCTWQPRQSL